MTLGAWSGDVNRRDSLPQHKSRPRKRPERMPEHPSVPAGSLETTSESDQIGRDRGQVIKDGTVNLGSVTGGPAVR